MGLLFLSSDANSDSFSFFDPYRNSIRRWTPGLFYVLSI